MSDNLQCVDIVFDRYIQGSLKSETRESRGSGVRILVNEATPIWKNWQQFLHNDDNKTELFRLLAYSLTSSPVLNGVIVATESENVLSSEDVNLSILEACNHEEADTRIYFIYSQNTRTFPLPVLKLVLYFSNIASISETRSVIL